MAGAIVTWLIKLGDWIRDLTAAGSAHAPISELLEFQSQDRLGHARRRGRLHSGRRSLAVGDRGRRLSRRDDPGRRRDHRRPRHDRPEDHHRRRPAGHARRRARRSSPRPSSATARSPSAPSASAPRRPPARSRSWSNPRRSATRACRTTPRSFADRLVLPTLGLAVGTAAVTARLQPLPVAGHRRLRHRHPRRRADRGARLDDACGARRHHHQERRATWSGSPRSTPWSSTRPAR